MSDRRVYSVVIPTYRRPDLLAECLESICALDYSRDDLEVLVIDNGGRASPSRRVVDAFTTRIPVRYLPNCFNRGYGYSVNRGIVEAAGLRILLLNDDARPMPDLLRECDRLLDADRTIGCVGCRAVGDGSVTSASVVGTIEPSGEVVANFGVDCGGPIEVEHIYGFCYVFTREAIKRAGLNDQTLLAQPYSSGNRIETDHCLTIRRSGLKVVYNPRMVAVHLGKPRSDMNELSLKWKLNATRNTIYLYLKHYGLFGKGGAALRLTFLVDVGFISMLRRPTATNLRYFLTGIRARASAFGHDLLRRAGWRELSVHQFHARVRKEQESIETDQPDDSR